MRLSGQEANYKSRFITRYARTLDQKLVNQIIGIEIMRRLMGVAQLPLQIDLTAKEALLNEAHELVTGNRL